MIEARCALGAVLNHSGNHLDVGILLRVAMYCNGMCEQMLRSNSVEQEGLIDVIEAINAGHTAVLAVAERLARSGRVGTSGAERDPLRRLVDAYEAIFTTSTRRESTAVLDAMPSARTDLEQ